MKIDWDNRWEKGYLIADSFKEYRDQMSDVVKDLLDELKLTIDAMNISNSTILDVGGGYGAVLKLLFNDSNDKYLIDLSDSAIRLSKEVYKLKNAYALNFITDEIPINQKFDFVLLSEVIEHIYPTNHKCLVEKIYSVLKTSGSVIVTTPNLASLSSRILLLSGRLPVIFSLDETHICGFTTKLLDGLFKLNGFETKFLNSTKIRFTPYNVKIPFKLCLGEHIIGVWRKKCK